jgi:tetratricopeptide (TPR) repeat protein
MVIAGIILAAAVFFVVISWWSEGYIGATEGVVLFVVYGGLLVGLFSAQSLAARTLALLPLLASTIWGGYLVKTWSLRSYHKEKAKQYEAAIDNDPGNFAARAKLAETLYELGETERAIAEMQIAVDMSPRAATPERHTLRRWQQDERLRVTRNIICFRCRHENERGLKACVKCGTELHYTFDATDTLKRNMHQFVAISVGLALAGMSLALLPFKYALLPVACAVLVAVGWSMLRRS